MKFVPFNPPQNKEKKNISKGTYEVNPPWHQVQTNLVVRSYCGDFDGNICASSILEAARKIAAATSSTGGPIEGGTVRINNLSMGSFDYVTADTTTISTFTTSDWFTNTEDTRSAWIIVHGDLTIDSGQTLTPSVRKLFTVLYVTGNLVVNGGISMTARGANHSGTGNSGGLTQPVNIRIGNGTFSAVTDPQIPATGGAGGSRSSSSGFKGIDGTNGGTGGGGSGSSLGGSSGAGSAGTCFTGGTGGSSGATGGTGGNGSAFGGRGGDVAPGFPGAAGGTGNPGGSSSFNVTPDGGTGTGGTLIIIVAGTLSGSGTISANGVNGVNAGGVGAGCSGGGSVTVLYGTDSSSITPTANGGTVSSGGNGGAGTARKLAIGSN